LAESATQRDDNEQNGEQAGKSENEAGLDSHNRSKDDLNDSECMSDRSVDSPKIDIEEDDDVDTSDSERQASFSPRLSATRPSSSHTVEGAS